MTAEQSIGDAIRERILDTAALTALVNTYACLVDDRRWDEVAALFADDAELVLPAPPADLGPTRRLEGQGAIRAELTGLESFILTSHAITGHRVEQIDGDRARGITRCEAQHVSRHPGDGSLRNLVWNLRYADEYQRIGAEWVFSSRRMTIDLIETRQPRIVNEARFA